MKSAPPLFFLGWLLIATRLEGALTLAGIFTDQAVLQREAAVPVWGWADPGAEIVLEFAGQKVTTTTGSDGKWITKLAAMAASAEPRVLKITAGDQSLTRSEVLVGDVWLCSGQSNMDASMSTPSPVLREAITKAGNPHLRLFATLNQFPDAPVQDTTGRWEPATPETVKRWTAVGYLFGLRIQRELGVPVGIVCSARGGTQIETWLPTAMLAANPANQFSCKCTPRRCNGFPKRWLITKRRARNSKGGFRTPRPSPARISRAASAANSPFGSHASPPEGPGARRFQRLVTTARLRRCCPMPSRGCFGIKARAIFSAFRVIPARWRT